MRTHRARILLSSLGLAGVLSIASPAAATAPAVFQGDPTDAGGQPLIVLPGVPRVDWGPDGKWNTADDVISPGIIGDVDVVVRTGGTYVPASGVIPSPASSLATAPAVSAGGLQFPLAGTEVPFQVIVSDGAAPPPAGHPLANADLNARGVLVLAYADLDGDGFIGPTNVDPAGSADNALERQEALFLAGRRLALLQAGLSSGGLGVTLGLPASAGGLGIVVAAGAITGTTPPLYKDGPWIATLLPCMWPIDPDKIIGGENTGPPDPIGLVDLEIAAEQLFCPAPGHPVLGAPYAIPLDGSSVTNDLARALSGVATAVAFARPVSAAGFVADIGRRVLPAIGEGGARQIVEPIVSTALADDGAGNAVTLAVFPADSLGNQADPPSPGVSQIDLEASANLRIVWPDTDADPSRETLPLDAAELASVVIDDAGGAGDGGSGGEILAYLDGELAGALRVTTAPTGQPGDLVTAKAVFRFTALPTTDKINARFEIDADAAAIDPTTHDLTVTMRNDNGEVFYTRTFPAGLLTPGALGRTFRYKDPSGVSIGRVLHLNVRRGAVNPLKHNVRIVAKGVDLSRVDQGGAALEVGAAFGPAAFEAALACSQAGSTLSCTR